jgi:hypothetical protein
MKDIETEIRNHFYRPTLSSVKLYWIRKTSVILAKWYRNLKMWSILIGVGLLTTHGMYV